MKVVQTTLTEAKHKLLEEYAKRNSMTIKEVLRQAIRAIMQTTLTLMTQSSHATPSSKRTGKKDLGSQEHDRYLYGENIMRKTFK
jgi:hypothetical protein